MPSRGQETVQPLRAAGAAFPGGAPFTGRVGSWKKPSGKRWRDILVGAIWQSCHADSSSLPPKCNDPPYYWLTPGLKNDLPLFTH